MKYTAAIVILGSLALLSGCYDGGNVMPTPYEYDGYVQLGWDAYQDGNFEESMNYFLEAVDTDPTLPDAYVGAGWAMLYLPDYWRVADDYFYMAIQMQAGEYPLSDFNEKQVQDTMWTTFQCLSPDLPPSVLDPILEETADSGLIWVGDQIHGIVGSADLPFRFKPVNSGVIAMFQATNSYTTLVSLVDSISGDWVYLTVPMATMDVGGENYYTWIGADEQINYTYRIFDQSGSGGQMMMDAMAGSCMLQDIRGESGDALLAAASAFALDAADPDYSFGSGEYYSGLESLNNMKVKGTAAAVTFALQYFKYAWFTCLSEGQGTTLDPTSPNFVTDLMAVIENMLNG